MRTTKGTESRRRGRRRRRRRRNGAFFFVYVVAGNRTILSQELSSHCTVVVARQAHAIAPHAGMEEGGNQAVAEFGQQPLDFLQPFPQHVVRFPNLSFFLSFFFLFFGCCCHFSHKFLVVQAFMLGTLSCLLVFAYFSFALFLNCAMRLLDFVVFSIDRWRIEGCLWYSLDRNLLRSSFVYVTIWTCKP
jgi:hypothetical protein